MTHTEKPQWVLCPRCKGKTRIMVVRETVIRKFPLFCPKCKLEMLVDVTSMKLTPSPTP